MFAGIYYGGMYGGSTTSILLNTPGESSSVMTAIEGNKMAKAGRAAQALATAAIGSFIAGTIGTMPLVLFAPPLADQAVKIGAPSYFAIMLLSLADGVDIVVAVGIFALGEALWVAAHLRRRPVDVIPVGRPFMGREDWGRSWGPWLRGTALGFPFGAVPAGGAETPTFLSYLLERRPAKKSGEFGKGAPSRASPGPRQPTTPLPQGRSFRCSRWACR